MVLLAELGASARRPVGPPELPEAVLLDDAFDAHGAPGWARGAFMPQSRAAMAVGRVLGPRPGERVLDLCAAPGGKTTHLAALMEDRGEIVAVERHPGRARALEPGAEIWFRPHPDVDAGHRRGAVRDADALALADRVVRGGAMADLLDRVDGVHVLTSLTGFEALLRGTPVTCHGQPFYAGWGLTRDLAPIARRSRQRSLAELVAATLIAYPRYCDPVTGRPSTPEALVDALAAAPATPGNARWRSAAARLNARRNR